MDDIRYYIKENNLNEEWFCAVDTLRQNQNVLLKLRQKNVLPVAATSNDSIRQKLSRINKLNNEIAKRSHRTTDFYENKKQNRIKIANDDLNIDHPMSKTAKCPSFYWKHSKKYISEDAELPSDDQSLQLIARNDNEKNKVHQLNGVLQVNKTPTLKGDAEDAFKVANEPVALKRYKTAENLINLHNWSLQPSLHNQNPSTSTNQQQHLGYGVYIHDSVSVLSSLSDELENAESERSHNQNQTIDASTPSGLSGRILGRNSQPAAQMHGTTMTSASTMTEHLEPSSAHMSQAASAEDRAIDYLHDVKQLRSKILGSYGHDDITQNKKFCIAVSAMIVVLSAAGLTIGLTIYFEVS